MNILILFSGTKSFSKVFNNGNNIIRTVDIDNYFKPTYNVDILKWDYKTDLKDFKVDYLHGSPVCKYFSKLQSANKNKPDINKGYILVDKIIEIINWIKKNNNSKLKFTIENPKNKHTLQYKPLMKYKHCITSYCQYGFLYQKDTTFWYGGFILKLKPRCNTKNICLSKSLVNNKVHKVRIGLGNKQIQSKDNTFGKNHKLQIGCVEYFKSLRLTNKYKNLKYSDVYFRYRIPELLIEDIKNCL
jgi:hypothetical protein